MFNFSTTKAFGLDLSDASIEVLQFKPKGKRARVIAYGRTTLKPGLIENGIIVRKTELAEKIKNLIQAAKPKAVRGKKAISAIPEAQTFNLIISLPANIPDQEIAKELEKIAQSRLPLDLSEALSDFKLISQNRNLKDFFYVACPKNIIRNYLEVFKLADLDLIVLEVESLALARSLLRSYNKDEASLICDLGARTTNLNIFDHQGIRYSEVIKIAGNLFTEKLSQELKMSWAEAEAFKIKQGLKSQEIDKVLQPMLNQLYQDIQQAINYYQREHQRAITKVFLAGGTALVPGLKNDFEQHLRIQVLTTKDTIYEPVMGLAFRGLVNKPEAAGINLIRYLNNN